MPIYEYNCSTCRYKFEELVSANNSNNIECPQCKSSHTEKLISAFGFVSKSGGITTKSSSSCGCGDCASTNCGNCSCGH
ncbi:MAG: zinc ribbon domain-containing protein [candidate division Zixibacteria bacterium]|nr:zinc ribbon domain-containing protein [candidate division Zixibacteria bacterium]